MRNTLSRAQETSATAASDEQLVARAQARDGNAFSQLVRRHRDTIYARARYLCNGHAENADDTVQNALMKAYSRLATFRGEAQFSSWLTRIVINECLLHRRRHAREQGWIRLDEGVGDDQTLPFEPADVSADPEEEYGRQEFQTSFQNCLAALPDSFRDVVILRVIKGLSIDEIATRVGLSPSGTKSRLLRARRQLQRSLRKKFCRRDQCYWPGTKIAPA